VQRAHASPPSQLPREQNAVPPSYGSDKMPDMLNDERSRAVAWLSSITDKEFAEAVHEAARVRCQTSTAVAHANRFVLACVSLDCDTDHWDLEVVALHDPLQ
jgi:hypothetical protein